MHIKKSYGDEEVCWTTNKTQVSAPRCDIEELKSKITELEDILRETGRFLLSHSIKLEYIEESSKLLDKILKVLDKETK